MSTARPQLTQDPHPFHILRVGDFGGGLIGAALFFSRRFKEAIPRLRVAIEETPVFQTPYRFLAACYAHGGLLDEARATIARLRAIASEVMVNYPLPFRDPQHRELYFSGLRLAMGETT